MKLRLCHLTARLAAFASATLLVSNVATASSHREAPFITELPKVDNTDVYAFQSYESGREDFTVIIANFIPLQDSYGGPNYFFMDPDARYEIHIDNDGNARPDITFRFNFRNSFQGATLNIGGENVGIPLIAGVGTVGSTADANSNLNVLETYSVGLVTYKKNGRKPRRQLPLINVADASSTFRKPVDYIGTKSIPNYEDYANDHIYSVNIPNCDTPGRMFVGQRAEGFVVNLGETFDNVNYNPVGAPNAENNTIGDKNITSLALEVPTACLLAPEDKEVTNRDVIGVWSTASLHKKRTLRGKPNVRGPARETGKWTQVSRLGNPLVNEVVIGINDKDRFNASKPHKDAQFLTYVTNPTLPAILEALFGVTAPTSFPREDLIDIFLTGVDGLNANGATCEYLRLNTSIAPVAAASQETLGVLAADNAGFPNGRRPGDDVVDIALRAVMGVLLDAADAPDGQLAYTDGAEIAATDFQTAFPFLNTPNPGSPD